jgi:STE24 endopeptidase
MRRASERIPAGALRLVAATVAAVIVAEAAVLILSPRSEVPDPLPVAEERYFEAAQLERARDYRGGQRTLFLIGLAIQIGVLLALALGRPGAARRALRLLERRPVLGGLAAGAAISVALALVALPTGLAAHERAVDVGISTQSLGPWLGDRGKAALIAAALAGAGAAVLLGLQRRLPRGWWMPVSGAVVAYAVIITWLAPVLLAPLFNRFDPLGPGPARDAVVELGAQADVEIGEVYRVDASRRVTSLNASVSGLGPTKRVVLYDNLLEEVERPALRSIVAHELGHVANRDVPRGLMFVAIVAPFGILFVRELGGALARRAGVEPGTPAALPGYALALVLATFGLGIAGNQLSRAVEARADAFALELTEDPQALIELQMRLAERNVTDPDPPGWTTKVLRTHPTTVERIGAALAWERDHRTGDGPPGG